MRAIRSWLALLTITAASATARADDDQEARGRAALQKFDEGRKALEAGEHSAALAAFSASHQLLPSPNSLLYMARCHHALGRVASAYTTFRLAYKQAQDRLVATGDGRYSATRDTAAREAAAIEADVPKLALMLPADAPDGVVVTANGVVVPRETWGVALDTDPGAIAVDAHGPRLVPFHHELVLGRGETKRVDVALVRVPTASLGVKLSSKPLGYVVRVDGAAVDPGSGPARQDVDPGRHVVEATAPGHRPVRIERTLADGEAAVIDVRWEAEARDHAGRAGTPRWLFYVTAASGAAALVAASALSIHADARSDAEREKDPLLRDRRERDGIRTESNLANGFYIGGAVFAAGAAVLAFTTDWKRSGSGATGGSVWLRTALGSVAAGGTF